MTYKERLDINSYDQILLEQETIDILNLKYRIFIEIFNTRNSISLNDNCKKLLKLIEIWLKNEMNESTKSFDQTENIIKYSLNNLNNVVEDLNIEKIYFNNMYVFSYLPICVMVFRCSFIIPRKITKSIHKNKISQHIAIFHIFRSDINAITEEDWKNYYQTKIKHRFEQEYEDHLMQNFEKLKRYYCD